MRYASQLKTDNINRFLLAKSGRTKKIMTKNDVTGVIVCWIIIVIIHVLHNLQLVKYSMQGMLMSALKKRRNRQNRQI